jgi:hypothetical protein
MKAHRVVSALLLVSGTGATASAQEWRTVDVSRQLRDSGVHRVHIEYGAGRLDVRPTTDRVLFAMQLKYDDANGQPLHRYDPEDRSLRVGISGQSIHVGKRMGEQTSGEMHLGLSRAVPLELDIDVGAAKAEFELGGLMLQEARIHTGAADARVSFTTPNLSRLRTLDVDVGAASFEAKGLANANTSNIRIKAGVGDVDLSLDGMWTQDLAVEATMALGKLTIRVPRDVGIRVDVKRFLASFDHPGLEKRGDAFYSANWESAPYKVRVRAETVLGAIEIARLVK